MPKDFIQRLREVIHALKIQDQEFAKAGGVTKATFSRYVQGKAEPNRKTLANWVDEYRINANWLLTGKGKMFQGKEAESTPQAADPITLRVETVERILRKSGASDAEIRAAVMAALQAGEAKTSEKDAERKVGNSEG